MTTKMIIVKLAKVPNLPKIKNQSNIIEYKNLVSNAISVHMRMKYLLNIAKVAIKLLFLQILKIKMTLLINKKTNKTLLNVLIV